MQSSVLNKSLLPHNADEFSDPQYWKEFFSKRGKTFEWYGDYNDLGNVLENYMKISDPILQIGCGNSNLASELHDAGYRNIHSIDLDAKVIEGQKKENLKKKGLTFDVMNATELRLPEESYSVVLDKGTLDALLPPAANAESKANVHKMFSEVSKVLKPTGRYLIITLAQRHIVEEWVNYFQKTSQYLVRLHKVDNKANGFHMPVFVMVATKLRKPMPMTMPLEVIRVGKQVLRCNYLEALLAHVTAEQELAKFVHLCSKKLTEEAVISFDGQQDKRYEFLVHDIVSTKEIKNMAAFLVPLGREREWLYCTKKGRREILRQMNMDRIVFIYLSRNEEYASVDEIKIETMPFLARLDPRLGHKDFPYATLAEKHDARTIIATGASDFNGDWYVEDVDEGEEVTRRLIFSKTSNLIQSEAYLKDGKVIASRLACGFHRMMLSSLSLSKKVLLKSDQEPFRLLVLGVGGGLVTTFAHDYFKKAHVTGVEIDEEVVKLARNHFGMPQDGPRFEVKVENALEYLKKSSQFPEASKFTAIFMDVAGDDPTLTCPPEAFLTDDALENLKKSLEKDGIVAINVVTRDEEKLLEVRQRLKKHFGKVSSVSDDEDINHVLICVNGEPIKKHQSNIPPEAKQAFDFIHKIRSFE